MRKQISPKQLAKRLESKVPKRILFSSEDQENYSPESPIWFSVVFDTVGIFYNFPCIISFTNSSSSMYLERISLIEIDEDANILGDDLFVYCDNINGETCYVFSLINN